MEKMQNENSAVKCRDEEHFLHSKTRQLGEGQKDSSERRVFAMDIIDSVLIPNDSQIRYLLSSRRTLAKVLFALSEEPCYLTELETRLFASKATIRKAVGFLKCLGLVREIELNSDIIEEMDDSESRKLLPLVQKKQKAIFSSLSSALVPDTLRRMKFYYISRRGNEFLNHARKCLFGTGG